MRRSIPVALLALDLSWTVAADEFPQRFEGRTKDRHVVIVLEAEGHAAYSSRTVRPNGTAWTFDDPAATWGWYETPVLGQKPGSKAVWIRARGTVDGKPREYRFDYHYQADRLEEFDTTGVVMSLGRVRDKPAPAVAGW